MSVTNNGATAWMRDPTSSAPIRILCLMRADIGAATRDKDEDPCLEFLDGYGSDPGTNTSNEDTNIDARWDETADKDAVISYFNDGRVPIPGEAFTERFKTDLAIALTNGRTILVNCWISSMKIQPIERSTMSKLSLVLPTNSLWTRGVADWDAGTGFDDFSDFQAPINTYYTSLLAVAGPAALGKNSKGDIQKATAAARRVAMQAAKRVKRVEEQPAPEVDQLSRWVG